MGRGQVYLTKPHQEYKELVAWACTQAGYTEPTSNPVSFTLDQYHSNSRSDIDNILKTMFDSLQGHIYLDDNQIKKLCTNWHLDRKAPRIELTISEIKIPLDRTRYANRKS